MNRFHKNHQDSEVREKYNSWANAMKNYYIRSWRPAMAKKVDRQKKAKGV